MNDNICILKEIINLLEDIKIYRLSLDTLNLNIVKGLLIWMLTGGQKSHNLGCIRSLWSSIYCH